MKLNLFRPREKFLIMEIAPSGTTGWFLGVDEDRNIIFEKKAEHIDIKNFFAFNKSPMRSVAQKAWEGEYIFKSRRRVIVAADPALATTIPIPLDLLRDAENAKSKITIGELENLIAQAMQKIFSGCRAEAAKRLKVHELDTIMVGAKAKHFTVDKKAVTSPMGFTGKKISLLLELTFTGRELFQDLKQFFNSPEDFFFVEAPQAYLGALSRVRKLPLNLIVAEGDKTSLYVLEKAKDEYPVLYREDFAWLFASFFEKLIATLAVSEKTAKELYRAYRKGEMSEDVKRTFKKIFDPAFQKFFAEIEKAKMRGTAYLDAAHVAPFDLPHRYGAVTFEEYPIGELLGGLGFDTDKPSLKKIFGEQRNEALRPLLYFLEAYFDRSNSDINQKLRRRLHWLAD